MATGEAGAHGVIAQQLAVGALGIEPESVWNVGEQVHRVPDHSTNLSNVAWKGAQQVSGNRCNIFAPNFSTLASTVACPAVPVPAHAQPSNYSQRIGNRISFKCDDLYGFPEELKKPVIKCTENAEWEPDILPDCTSEYLRIIVSIL